MVRILHLEALAGVQVRVNRGSSWGAAVSMDRVRQCEQKHTEAKLQTFKFRSILQ